MKKKRTQSLYFPSKFDHPFPLKIAEIEKDKQ